MNYEKLTQTLRWGLVAIASLLIAIAGLTYYNLHALDQARVRSFAVRQLLLTLAQFRQDIVEVEDAQRGYLVTGDETDLARYQSAVQPIGGLLDTLEQKARGEPMPQEAVAKLRSDTASGLKELAMTIETRRQSGLDAARTLVSSKSGRRTMDEVLASTDALSALEDNVLADRRDTSTRNYLIAEWSCLGSGLIALLALLVFWALTRRQISFQQALVQELQAQKERLRVTLASIGDAVITTDRNCKVTFLNGVAESLTGWMSADAIGRPLDEVFLIVDETTRVPVENPAQRALRDGMIVGLANHTVLVSRHGEEYPIDDSAAPIVDGANTIGVVLVFRDVSLRKRNDEALWNRESQFRTLAQAMPNFVWTSKPDGQLDWFNKWVYSYSGAVHGQLHGTGWASIVHPADLPVAAERWTLAVASGEAYENEFRLRRADGLYRWHLARALPIHDTKGNITQWVGTNTDIEAQKSTAQALEHLNAALEHQVAERTADRDRIWQLSSDLMLMARFDGIITAVNPAWTAVLAWPTVDLSGRSLFDLVHPDDRDSLIGIAQALSEGTSFKRVDTRYRHQDGHYRWIAWAMVPGADLINAVGRDFTAEKEQSDALLAAQDALRQSQKMEAVGQLTGGLAHDFNNLLAGISGSLELLTTRLGQGRLKELDRYVSAAQESTRRAAGLTHRLLAFSRRQSLDPKPTDINRLVAGMDELIRRTVGPEINIERVSAAGLWPSLIDANQLENALLNLCINARDAMPEGGRLTIETANKWLDERAARERDVSPGQYISLCVTDTGTGMTPEVIAHAFDPFFTTKPLGMGTGLGLSMTYGFARQSGGQVRIYSELGLGTTMCLYLPRHHGEKFVEETPVPALPSQSSEQGRTVLVVDDEVTVRLLIKEVLEDLGYSIFEAGDGATGLQILQSNARIDLLISDVGLPGGLNGRQLADAGRLIRPGLKVLFITGYAENAVVRNGHLEPGMQLLTKPFALDALAARVASLVSGT